MMRQTEDCPIEYIAFARLADQMSAEAATIRASNTPTKAIAWAQADQLCHCAGRVRYVVDFYLRCAERGVPLQDK